MRGDSKLPPRKPGDPYTVQEAAESLRISKEVLYRIIQAGDLTAMRIGTGKGRSILRIAEADLAAYVEKARGQSDAKPVRAGKRMALKHLDY